jgi:hypothetical protein
VIPSALRWAPRTTCRAREHETPTARILRVRGDIRPETDRYLATRGTKRVRWVF